MSTNELGKAKMEEQYLHEIMQRRIRAGLDNLTMAIDRLQDSMGYLAMPEPSLAALSALHYNLLAMLTMFTDEVCEGLNEARKCIHELNERLHVHQKGCEQEAP